MSQAAPEQVFQIKRGNPIRTPTFKNVNRPPALTIADMTNEESEASIKSVAAKSKRGLRSYRSVDGKTYSIRMSLNNGEEYPHIRSLILYHALIEMLRGGDPCTVLDAVGFQLKDAEGQDVYPISQEGQQLSFDK